MTASREDRNGTGQGSAGRTARSMMRVVLTLCVAAVAASAVILGSRELAQRADAAPAPEAAPVMPVLTAPVALSPGYEVTRSFIGQIEAQRTAAVSFELGGRLEDILVDEGDSVWSGQPIARLDTRLIDAERDRLAASRAALEAQLRFAEQTVERQSRLSDRGFASQAALDGALSLSDELHARIAEVEAALMSNAIQAEKSRIQAPFAGRVTERRVDGGESVSPGQTLVQIVEDGAARLRVGLPLDVDLSDLAEVTVEVDGTRYEASLVTLRPDVDPVTRTRTAIFRIGSDDRLAYGQTARLLLRDEVEAQGLWVPVTTLKEGQRGQWTLLAVDADDTVRALTVEVLHTRGDEVFVRGAFPDGTRLIVAGPQRVTPGQMVDPQPAS